MSHLPTQNRRWRTIRIATYNVHRCKGLDGRTNPERTADVIRALNPDIIALQEVIGASPQSAGHAETLGGLLGMGWAMAATRHLRKSLFGNVVLSRFPIRHHVQHDLSWKTCEARCCQRVDLEIGDDVLHLYNVHLGTAILERRHQAERVSTIVHDARVGEPKVVLGDFNEWLRGAATALLSERLESIDLRHHLRRRRTYPGVFPVLHLDHIFHAGAVEVVKLELPRTKLSLMASDHLPLLAELRIGF